MTNNKLEKLVCNRCSKEIQRSGDIHSDIQSNLMHNFNVEFGYGSDYDMTKCKFTLCENCLCNIMLTFDIKPLFKEVDILG